MVQCSATRKTLVYRFLVIRHTSQTSQAVQFARLVQYIVVESILTCVNETVVKISETLN